MAELEPVVPSILVATARYALWQGLLTQLGEAREVLVFATGAKLRDAIAYENPVTVLVDPHLPDMNGYDLCGWVRAHFRDLPIRMLGDMKLDTRAVDLDEEGATWTVSEALRAKMSDPSVLEVTLDSIPIMVDEVLASSAGITLEELARDKAEIFRKTGFTSMQEYVHRMRNLPRSQLREMQREPRRREGTGDRAEILAVTARPELWLDLLERVEEEAQRPVIVVEGAAHAKEVLAALTLAGVMVDPELPDMSGYDLAGFIRAHFRDLPLRILGDDDVELDAVELGASWTVPDSLRAKMTDESVLQVTPESIPVMPLEIEADALGMSIEEVERFRAAELARSGFATMAELLHHARNPPRRGREQ